MFSLASPGGPWGGSDPLITEISLLRSHPASNSAWRWLPVASITACLTSCEDPLSVRNMSQPCLCLPVYSNYISACPRRNNLFVYSSTYLSVCYRGMIYLSVYSPIFLSVCLSRNNLFIRLVVYPSVCLYLYEQLIFLSSHLYIYLFMSLCLFVSLAVLLSICPSASLLLSNIICLYQ